MWGSDRGSLYVGKCPLGYCKLILQGRLTDVRTGQVDRCVRVRVRKQTGKHKQADPVAHPDKTVKQQDRPFQSF